MPATKRCKHSAASVLLALTHRVTFVKLHVRRDLLESVSTFQSDLKSHQITDISMEMCAFL
jgi:hypothetical protein